MSESKSELTFETVQSPLVVVRGPLKLFINRDLYRNHKGNSKASQSAT